MPVMTIDLETFTKFDDRDLGKTYKNTTRFYRLISTISNCIRTV